MQLQTTASGERFATDFARDRSSGTGGLAPVLSVRVVHVRFERMSRLELFATMLTAVHAAHVELLVSYQVSFGFEPQITGLTRVVRLC